MNVKFYKSTYEIDENFELLSFDNCLELEKWMGLHPSAVFYFDRKWKCLVIEDNYFEFDGKPLGETQVKWLHDDYVKFIRFSHWKIESTGIGIVALITNNGYLDNPTFRGMRWNLLKTFDKIYIVDLHGNTMRKETCQDGSIEGRFPCRRLFQGYDGLLHGGVISAVLDSAMTNCLFAHGIVAVTGELTVRFLQPVLLTHEAVVQANIKESFPPLHCMEARLMQKGRIVARATARFMERAV